MADFILTFEYSGNGIMLMNIPFNFRQVNCLLMSKIVW